MSKKEIAWWLLLAILVLCWVFVWMLRSHAFSAPKAYIPSHEQALELQVLQLRAIAEEKQYTEAQASYNASLRALAAKADEIRKQNHWPEGLAFNKLTLEYSLPPAKPPAGHK